MGCLRRAALTFLVACFVGSACPACSGGRLVAGEEGDGARPGGPEAPEARPPPARPPRSARGSVHGWILLDDHPDRAARSIEAAARYGVDHVQLSHGLVRNVDDLLGPAAEERVQRLEAVIGLAHAAGLEAYAWSQELSNIGPGVDFCYAPESDDFRRRKQAYREAFARLPDLDGIVLGFGSAQRPPWYTTCTCAWCLLRYPLRYPILAPPNAERIRLLTQTLGDVIVNELGRRLVVRTFLHDPSEVAWHAEGLAAVQGVRFLGMHKSEVQDWQPYHPPDPSLGGAEGHGAIVELDAAGQYYGLSVLPFAAPEYFAFRLRHAFSRGAVGAAVRIERGRHTALGTPNEINLRAVRELLADPSRPIETIWDGFLAESYGLAPGTPAQATLERSLENTFEIRLKSHYVLGLWALEKGSDLPDSTRLDEFEGRGEAPRWDPRWTDLWRRLFRPDEETLIWIWQEASEAVELAQVSLAALDSLEGQIGVSPYADLRRRFVHQERAAEAWRAVKLFLWSDRMCSPRGGQARRELGGSCDTQVRGWGRWAREELERIRAAMLQEGLGDVPIAGPRRIATFLENTAWAAPAGPARRPDVFRFSPLETLEGGATDVCLGFTASAPARVSLDYGLDAPELDSVLDVGSVPAQAPQRVCLRNLAPGQRYLARLRARIGDRELRGGYHWIFTAEE